MTDINYDKLKGSTVAIIENVEGFLSDFDIEKLTILKKKLGLIKGIIGDIAKINDCCGKNGGIDPLVMMMMMKNMNDGKSPEDTLKKNFEYFRKLMPKNSEDPKE